MGVDAARTVGAVEQIGGPTDVPVRYTHPDEVTGLSSLVERLRSENARLLRLLELTSRDAAVPGPVQSGWFEAVPGPCTMAHLPSRTPGPEGRDGCRRFEVAGAKACATRIATTYR